MDAKTLTTIEGPNLFLRLIDTADADYVHGLRTNPSYNMHLSEAAGTAEDQRKWIASYKAREADLRELYYVIERKDGTRCGLVRLYDIKADHFTWGSWILDSNKPSKAALESAVLSFGVGFEDLGRAEARVDVRIHNTHAVAFYRRFGMTETHRTAKDIYFTYPRTRFRADRVRFMEIIAVAQDKVPNP